MDKFYERLDVKNSAPFYENLWIPAVAICLAGFLFNFIAVFPGLMSPDSFVMYNEAVEWKFRDHHHPFIGVLMGIGRFIRDDPSPYLFFQLSLFWGGIYMFFLALRNQVGKWAIIGPFIGLLPFNLSLSGYLHKTPLLTACFFFSCSWLFLTYTKNKKLGLAQVIILTPIIFLGAAVRGYSYLAALPILGFMVWIIIKKKSNTEYGILLAAGFSFLLVILFIGLNHILVYKVLNAERTYKSRIIYQIDLAAIYAMTGKVYATEVLKEEFRDWNAIRRIYNETMESDPWKISRVYQGSAYADDVTKEYINRLKSEWLRAVSENPYVYIEHRIKTILKTFGVTHKMNSAFKGFSGKCQKNTHNLVKYDTIFWTFFKNYVYSVKDEFFMRPWFWALLNIIFSAIGFVLISIPRYRDLALPHCVMLWSGLLLLAPYILLCLSADNRFTYWITVATSFGGFGITTILLNPIKKRHTLRLLKHNAI